MDRQHGLAFEVTVVQQSPMGQLSTLSSGHFGALGAGMKPKRNEIKVPPQGLDGIQHGCEISAYHFVMINDHPR